MRWAWHVVRKGMGACKVLVEKCEVKGSFGRPRLRWKGHIKKKHSRHIMEAWNGLMWPRVGTGGELL